MMLTNSCVLRLSSFPPCSNPRPRSKSTSNHYFLEQCIYLLCFVCSVDARERDFAIAERWSDEGVFANRAYFMPERRPAQLGVDRARETDQGLYRCRVDFKVAQTRNSKVNLTVIGKSNHIK